MATYAIGDIQGCFDEFQALLEAIRFSDQDRLWIAGDLVNRGPKSLETLRYIHALGDRAQVVLGNHDLHMLAVYYGVSKAKRSDTFDDVFAAEDAKALMRWLRQQPLLITDETLGFSMAHAGIPPNWTLKKAHKRAREVETILQSTLAKEFFKHMYGNRPATWSGKLEGWQRLRMITNAFTRMRFCNGKGRLNLTCKGSPGSQPQGYKPWFLHANKLPDNHRIIFGHWAALEGNASPAHVFALDTGCVWGDRLTSLRLEDQQYFSVNSLKRYGN